MKLTGHTFSEPNIEICVIPRADGNDVVFKAQAVLDYDDFEKYCPEPQPPEIRKPGQGLVKNYEDATYLAEMQKRSSYRMAWTILKSLEATEGLKWETIEKDKPKTWENYKKELTESFFSTVEIQRIQNAAFNANALNESRVQEARENFLRGQAEARKDTSGQPTEPNSTPSGKPANS